MAKVRSGLDLFVACLCVVTRKRWAVRWGRWSAEEGCERPLA